VYNNNVILISASATEVSLTADGANPYFFRTTPRDDAQSTLEVQLLKKMGFTKVAIIHDKGDYGKALADLAKDEIEADKASGIEIVMFEGITTGQVSFDSVISKLRNSGAQALLWGGYYHDASKLVIQMRSKKLDTVVIGADGLKNEAYLQMAGSAAEGTFATGQTDLSNNPLAAAAVANHKERYPTEDIGPYFLYAAGATEALLAAVEKAGSLTDLAAIKANLHENTVETVMGPISFDERGDVVGAGFRMFVVKDGAYVEVDL
ncbi:MAG: branched-chain amino acid ABC transporter substrate-binding protein, partial [Candidatus Adiutrix sp.]